MKLSNKLLACILVQFLALNLTRAEFNPVSIAKTAIDTIPDCRILIKSQNGVLKLEAVHGKGIGPNIKYMPEWKAFGYFNESDRIEWIMEVAESGTYDIFLEWSAAGSVVGNPYEIEIGEQVIQRKVEDTGSWEVFKRKLIGKITIDKGLHRLVFKPTPQVTEAGYLDVRALELFLRN